MKKSQYGSVCLTTNTKFEVARGCSNLRPWFKYRWISKLSIPEYGVQPLDSTSHMSTP